MCDKVAKICVSVTSAACPYVIEDESLLANDNAILVGAFAHLPATAPLRDATILAYREALRELELSAGLPPGATGARRPVVALLCDDAPATRAAALAHLVQLHVPAVITSFTPQDNAAAFTSTLLPAGIFTLTASPTTNAFRSAAGTNGLSWNITGSAEDPVPAHVATLVRAEAYVRSTSSMTGDVRVAVIYTDDPSDIATASNFRTSLRFNGRTAFANENVSPSAYLSLQVPSLDAHPGATYDTTVSTLAAFAPHIIIAITGDELGGAILPGLETARNRARSTCSASEPPRRRSRSSSRPTRPRTRNDASWA